MGEGEALDESKLALELFVRGSDCRLGLYVGFDLMQRLRLKLSMAFLLENRSFLSAHKGGLGGLDKRGVVAVGTTLRRRPGLCCAPGYIIRLEHSKRSIVLSLSKMFSLLCCRSTRYGIMSAHDRLVFAIITYKVFELASRDHID